MDEVFSHYDPTFARDTQWLYDIAGNRLETLHVSFEGVVKQSVYDPQTDRLKQERFFADLTQYNNGNGTLSEVWTYWYDAFGRTIEVTQSASTLNPQPSTLNAQPRSPRLRKPRHADRLTRRHRQL